MEISIEVILLCKPGAELQGAMGEAAPHTPIFRWTSVSLLATPSMKNALMKTSASQHQRRISDNYLLNYWYLWNLKTFFLFFSAFLRFWLPCFWELMCHEFVFSFIGFYGKWQTRNTSLFQKGLIWLINCLFKTISATKTKKIKMHKDIKPIKDLNWLENYAIRLTL